MAIQNGGYPDFVFFVAAFQMGKHHERNNNNSAQQSFFARLRGFSSKKHADYEKMTLIRSKW